MVVMYLKALVDCWTQQREESAKQKNVDFGDDARLLWGFMNKSYKELYITGDYFRFATPDQQGPYYKPRIYKCREFVNVVLPFVHAKIPHRRVESRGPPLPAELSALAQMPVGTGAEVPNELAMLQGLVFNHNQLNLREQITAWLLQWYLNYIPAEYGAKREQRICIQEALVKGRGICWHEVIPDAPAGRMPASHFDTVDGLFCDPEAKQWRDQGFIIRERYWPSWRLADVFARDEYLDAEKIRAAAESDSSVTRSGTENQPTAQRERDSCRWFQVFSRIGMGERLHTAGEILRDDDRVRTDAVGALEPNIYLAILPGLDFPLNVSPKLWEEGTPDELANALRWPIAFYADKANPFPCTPLDIYPNAENPWATSPLQAGMALQIFLDHLYSFLMSRIRVTSRDIIITAKSLEEALRKAIEKGLDQTIVPVDSEMVPELEKLIHILSFPPVQADLWKILAQTERAFEQATGMDPLLYGGESGRQMRSAREAGIREAHVTNRPNDYADAVEEWNSQVAKAEGQMARLYIRAQDVAQLFSEPVPMGPEEYGPASRLWEDLVNVETPEEAVADLHYTVEAGSGRRKNRQNQLENIQELMAAFAPILQVFAQGGQVGPWNNLVDILESEDLYGLPLGKLKLPEMAMMPSEEEEEGPSKETS